MQAPRKSQFDTCRAHLGYAAQNRKMPVQMGGSAVSIIGETGGIIDIQMGNSAPNGRFISGGRSIVRCAINQ
jgi:hypothetical protein